MFMKKKKSSIYAKKQYLCKKAPFMKKGWVNEKNVA